jgi:hypothetical protein
LRNPNKQTQNDIEICKSRIIALLEEFNCELLSADEWHRVLIRDRDTQETKGFGKYG